MRIGVHHLKCSLQESSPGMSREATTRDKMKRYFGSHLWLPPHTLPLNRTSEPTSRMSVTRVSFAFKVVSGCVLIH